MTSLAEQLASGPRGRRLCLDAAGFAESQVSRAIFDLRFELDPGTKVRLTIGDGEPERFDVAAALRLLRGHLAAVERIDDHLVREALEATVDGARYWQEPDGGEVLASRPEIASEIGGIAELVAASPAARWWTDPLVPEQFQVRKEGWSDNATRPPAHVALAQWREEATSRERRATTERPSDPRANFSDIWWSVPPHILKTTCPVQAGIPTGLYLVEDGFGETRATVHRATGSGRTLEIDSPGVWADLCRAHPLDATASKRHDWYRTTGLADTRWVMPDWVAVAERYDAVHLQVGTYLAASGTAIAVEEGVHSVIAGWAPGDTFWLTDTVEIDPAGQEFVRGADDLWSPSRGG